MMKKRQWLWIALIWLVTLAVCFTATFLITKRVYAPSEETADAYALAMRDSVFADADEILPLVTITKDSDMVTWNEAGDKVLMVSWHKYPESYPDGSTFVCSYGDIWTFTDREILSWYEENHEGVEDWELRFEQLIGLPVEKEYTHFTAFWVDTDELARPAYQTDITKQISEADLDGSALGDYKAWFDDNVLWSYFDSAYPWTRLGYTYDWKEDDAEYGLSEFLILEGSTAEVAWTVTTEEFLNMLASGTMSK